MSKLLVVLLLLAVGGYVIYNKSAAPETGTTQQTQTEMTQTDTASDTTPAGAMIESRVLSIAPLD